MRHLTRLPEPKVLIDKSKRWTEAFINSGKKRPDANKYGRSDIRALLNSISFQKCYYCETLLKNSHNEVDHFIEVSIDKNLAYSWENLYLSCNNCNDKLDHNKIPVTSVLDPCKHIDSEIESHITFNKETITMIYGSTIGENTIKKFKLDEPLLDYLRGKHLTMFTEVLFEIARRRIREKRNSYKTSEIDIIKSFLNPDQPYSLMMKIYFENNNILESLSE